MPGAESDQKTEDSPVHQGAQIERRSRAQVAQHARDIRQAQPTFAREFLMRVKAGHLAEILHMQSGHGV